MKTNIVEEASKRVLVLDGAMGTMIQRHGLVEEDFRGDLYIPADVKVKGCNDLLCLTRPDVIRGIHRAYIEAGADIIETNSFNANAVSMAEYGLSEKVPEINLAAARLARDEADAAGRQVFVAGSVGPSNVALSIAGAGGDVTFDSLAEAFREQCAALIEGGVDTLLLETIFDTLNAKAAILGARRAMRDVGREVPLMISATLTPQGRTLSGQELRAFLASVRHAEAFSIGLNCSFGAEEMAPFLNVLANEPAFVSLHPNAGLPDELGRYTETPEKMAATLKGYLDKKKLNIVGGCCGTTPDHIRKIAEAARYSLPRVVPESDSDTLSLSGLEPCEVKRCNGFLKVGERCNVAGSRKFLRLVNEGNLPAALEIATAQIGKGAKVLDINMDDGMLEAPVEMENFVTLLGADASTSRLPLMIDSSDMEVIRRALRQIQGRPIVNSISLKNGEEEFLEHAREIRELGGAVVVMAFDENGQATTLDRRIEICRRAYILLTGKAGYKGSDIVFDPNILTIATGMPEHDRYALDFLNATEWIKKNLPGAKVSGGVSNLSFAFRGHDKLREAMHTVFLHHAIERGMDMAIVNPATSLDIDSVDPTLREAIEDLIFCRRQDATDRLMEIARRMKEERDRLKAEKQDGLTPPVPKKREERVTVGTLIEKGLDTGLEELLDRELNEKGSALAVVRETLMGSMQRVGDEFGAGRMFLPQVVRSASVMKKSIEFLTPFIEAETGGTEHKSGGIPFVLATVKGDVHDIGKNILGVILRCSGFEVIDLGVMVEGERIIRAVKDNNAYFLGLSGLITPSLSEMSTVAGMLEQEGLTGVTLFVGGATTSDLHTAMKIAPLFSGLTVHTRDAATLPPIAALLSDQERREEESLRIRTGQQKLREEYYLRETDRRNGATTGAVKAEAVVTPMETPRHPGLTDLRIPVGEIEPLINWRAFLHVWKLSPALSSRALEEEHSEGCPCGCADDKSLREARLLISDARKVLDELKDNNVTLDARVVLCPAHRETDEIVVVSEEGSVRFPTLRQEQTPALALADFVAESNDWVGLFVVTARNVLNAIPPTGDDYRDLLVQSMADLLVEAATERMHTIEHEKLHGLTTPRGIRPAIGYPSLPDQLLVHEADRILHYSDFGITLTENGALSPSATTTGFIFASPNARYFEVGPVGEPQLAAYARRRGMTVDELRYLLPRTT